MTQGFLSLKQALAALVVLALLGLAGGMTGRALGSPELDRCPPGYVLDDGVCRKDGADDGTSVAPGDDGNGDKDGGKGKGKDKDRGHGNDEDRKDDDNPGKGKGKGPKPK